MPQAYELTLAEVITETDDARSFVFHIPDALKPIFEYRPGQFLTVEIPWEGGFDVRRCYSLSSTPGMDAKPQVTVKRVEGGRVSNWMIDTLAAGHTLRVQPPEGRFVLDDAAPDSRALLLLGGGSGITPLLSLLKHTLAHTERRCVLVYANRHEGAVIFKAALDALVAAYPGRFTAHHHLDSEGGYLTADALAGWIEGIGAADAYVCGPTAFMDMAESVLNRVGVPAAHQRYERFVSPVDPDRKQAPQMEDLDLPSGLDGFTLRLEGTLHQVAYQDGQTLLESAKAAGVNAPHSCEDGFCGACMCKLIKGDVRMDEHEALSKADLANGMVLLCQARPASADPIVVDYDGTAFAAAGEVPAPIPVQGGGMAWVPAVVAGVGAAAAAAWYFLG